MAASARDGANRGEAAREKAIARERGHGFNDLAREPSQRKEEVFITTMDE
jgi:hypothetical protein